MGVNLKAESQQQVGAVRSGAGRWGNFQQQVAARCLA